MCVCPSQTAQHNDVDMVCRNVVKIVYITNEVEYGLSGRREGHDVSHQPLRCYNLGGLPSPDPTDYYYHIFGPTLLRYLRRSTLIGDPNSRVCRHPDLTPRGGFRVEQIAGARYEGSAGSLEKGSLKKKTCGDLEHDNLVIWKMES